MKKLLLPLILGFLFFHHEASAQNYDNAAGLRLGWGFGGTIKHFFDDSKAVEGIFQIGGLYARYAQVTGLFQVHRPLEDVAPGLQWYFGGGGFIGFFSGVYSTRSTRIGIAGNIGLDYTFDDIPLNVSLDWVPGIAIVGFGSGFGAGSGGGLAVRYIF
ncbi:MAG: hypothetical protein KDC53_06155 [Saprospiraceae bacterium]|nr:hypothetical protein [Saprospiraceae bacterium]